MALSTSQTSRLRTVAAWWALAAIPIAFLAVFFLWPIVAIGARGLFADHGWDVDGMAATVADPRTLGALRTTLILSLVGTLGSVCVGVPAAYALYRLTWRGQNVVRAIAAVPFVLPTVVVAAAFSTLFARQGALGRLGWDQTPAAIVSALIFFNVPVVTRIVGSMWVGLDSGTAVAARSLGANRWTSFRKVTLPSIAPAITSAAAIVFLFCTTSFGIVLILGGTRIRTLETEIYIQLNQFLNLRAAAVLALIQLGLVVTALALSDRVRRRDPVQSRRAAEGSRRATVRDVPVITSVLVPLAFIVIAPLASLVERSLRTRQGHGLDNYIALIRPPHQSVLSRPVWQAAVNSLEIAAVSSAIAVGVGLLVAQLVARRTRRGAALEKLVSMPLGVSAVLLGLGVLLTVRGHFGGASGQVGWWVIPTTQALVALPLVVHTLVPSARATDPRLVYAAGTLGYTRWKAWRAVDWPLQRRGVGIAIGFAFAISLGEFSATSFLAPSDRPTLPTAIYRLLSHPGPDGVGTAFAAAAFLAALTAGVIMAAERLQPRKGGSL